MDDNNKPTVMSSNSKSPSSQTLLSLLKSLLPRDVPDSVLSSQFAFSLQFLSNATSNEHENEGDELAVAEKIKQKLVGG